jgi:hypothetical protein
MLSIRDVKKGEQVADLTSSSFRSFSVNTKGRPSVAVVLSNNMFEVRSAKKNYGPFEIADIPSNASVQVVLQRGKRAVVLLRNASDYELRAYNVNKKGLKQIGETITGSDLQSAFTSGGDVVIVQRSGTQFKTMIYDSALKSKGNVTLDGFPVTKGKTMGEIQFGNGKIRVHGWK